MGALAYTDDIVLVGGFRLEAADYVGGSSSIYDEVEDEV